MTRRSIRTRLLVAFVGLAIVPLLVVGVVIAWQSFIAQRQQALELQAEAARRAATEVAGFISGLEQELRIVAQVHHLTNLDSEALDSVLSRLGSYGDDFEELALLDSRGDEIAHVSRSRAITTADLAVRSDEDEFLVPKDSRETYHSSVRFDEVTGEPFMTMAVPLIDVRGGLVEGVLVADIRLKEIWDLIAHIRVGESGSAYIVDDEERVVAHRDPSVVLRGTRYIVPESDGIHRGITGANVVLAAEEVPLGAQTLTVVTERPLSEALALTLRTVFITVGLILAALVCAGLLGFYATRKIVRPIRALAATAQAISAGELWRKAETTSRDEIGVLGGAFNRMTAQLRDMIESLEQRVVERTTELSAANTTLESEIAERRRAEEELRDAVQSLRALIQASPLPIVSIDRDTNVQIWNPAAERIFGWSEHEVLDRPLPIVPEDGREEFRLYWEQLLQGKAIPGREMPRLRKDGSLVDVAIWPAPLRDSKGDVSGAIAVSVDLTERRQAEETGRELAVAEERNRLAREIHDTLAQSLIGMMVRLERAGKVLLREPESAASEIESARQLAQQSLEDARRSVWDLHLDRRDFGSLSEAIESEVRKHSADGTQISLEVAGQEPGLVEPRNELAALRIVQEALSNVRRHSNAKSATVRLRYGASEVRVVVSDNGDGFERADVGGMLSPTGGGFGLTSMQERARLSGGRIEVHSAPGSGTQIDAWIPYRTAAALPAATYSVSTEVDLQDEKGSCDIRVLLVDDQEMARLGIRSMLEDSDGLVVVGEAADGEQAVAKVEAIKPDVVLLDIHMPTMDGVETMKRLRELGLETRVILLSVYAKDEYIFDGLRAGARGYLLKDIGEDELARAIRTVHAGGSLLPPVITKRLIEHLEGEPGPQLTGREMEVLRALASGARDKEIAGELSLSVRTIRFHVANIYQKLDVQTRTQAVRVASERGILSS